MSASPLTCLVVDSQYDGQPLKSDEHEAGEHARKVPVHPALAGILEWWRTEGFRLVHLRVPTPDDFIVPNSVGECYSRTAAYGVWIRALEKAGVANLSLHSTRRTIITLARRGGARPDVLERVTHNAKGAVIDQYTHWDWGPLCEAVSCLSLGKVGATVGAVETNEPKVLVAPPGIEPRTGQGTPENHGSATGNDEVAEPQKRRGLLGTGQVGGAARQPSDLLALPLLALGCLHGSGASLAEAERRIGAVS